MKILFPLLCILFSLSAAANPVLMGPNNIQILYIVLFGISLEILTVYYKLREKLQLDGKFVLFMGLLNLYTIVLLVFLIFFFGSMITTLFGYKNWNIPPTFALVVFFVSEAIIVGVEYFLLKIFIFRFYKERGLDKDIFYSVLYANILSLVGGMFLTSISY